jgi:hypothetical protein
MEMIKCSEKPEHVRQPSEDDSKVQNLMTGSVYIMLSRIPFLRDLLKSQLSPRLS